MRHLLTVSPDSYDMRYHMLLAHKIHIVTYRVFHVI